MKNKLDLKTIKNLYEFGALLTYEVRYIDKLTFTVKTDIRTFSKEQAQKNMAAWIKKGFEAAIFSYFIQFDGAYSCK